VIEWGRIAGRWTKDKVTLRNRARVLEKSWRG